MTIDNEGRRLTLTAPGAFTTSPGAVAVPFKFNSHVPQVEGTLDGIAGAFDLDTGARDSLTLLVPFVEKNGLKARYAPRVEGVKGWGVGGPSRGLVTRAKVLTLGGVRVEKPVTELSLQAKGSFVDPYVAGNVGGGVLKRFTVTFDYARQVVTFEPNGNADGRAASALTLPAVRERFKTDPPGTKVRLTVRTKGATREVTLVLRDLV